MVAIYLSVRVEGEELRLDSQVETTCVLSSNNTNSLE